MKHPHRFQISVVFCHFQLAAILRLGCCCDLHWIVSFACGLCVFIAGGVFSVWAFASDHFSLVGMIIMLTSILIYVFLSRVDQVRPDFLLQIVFICLYAKSKRSQNKSTHFVPLRKWKATCKPVRTAWCLVCLSPYRDRSWCPPLPIHSKISACVRCQFSFS